MESLHFYLHLTHTLTQMVSELRELTYKDRLKEMGLPTLQDTRKREDLITLWKIINGIEKLDKQDLVMIEEGTRQMREYSKIKKSQSLKDNKK